MVKEKGSLFGGSGGVRVIGFLEELPIIESLL